METDKLSKKLAAALEELKAVDIQVIDVREITTITDVMIFSSGKSNRQVKALSDKIVETAKSLEIPMLGIEGEQQAEWILVDLGDVVVHIMQPSTRTYYQLEKLWTSENKRAESST